MQNKQLQHLDFCFFLLPDFSMMSLSAMIEPLRMANKVLSEDFYRWHILTWQDKSVNANNGLLFHPEHLCADLQSAKLDTNYLILVAGDNIHQFYHSSLRSLIKSCYRRSMNIGATSTAAFLLADADLLDNRCCTVHWEYLTAFQEEYPQLTVTQNLFEIDGRILTCSGGVGGLDMLLQVIRAQHGSALSDKIADQYLHNNVRDSGSEQRNSLVQRYNVHHPSLVRVLTLMEANIEQPLSLTELADRAHLSRRQLQRLFARDFKQSVQQFYRNLRLDKASILLRETDMSSASIALVCGFSSSSYFSQCYRQYTGVTPRELRAIN
jgi:transcriptional regulator GlxA family with amidase domain